MQYGCFFVFMIYIHWRCHCKTMAYAELQRRFYLICSPCFPPFMYRRSCITCKKFYFDPFFLKMQNREIMNLKSSLVMFTIWWYLLKRKSTWKFLIIIIVWWGVFGQKSFIFCFWLAHTVYGWAVDQKNTPPRPDLWGFAYGWSSTHSRAISLVTTAEATK